MKFLVVDDSKTMRMIVIRYIRSAGYGDAMIYEAANGVEALDIVSLMSPDMILCDWNMPVMNGLELLQTLRGQGNRILFGFVTSERSEEMHRAALEAGATFLLSKPFDQLTFNRHISQVVAA